MKYGVSRTRLVLAVRAVEPREVAEREGLAGLLLRGGRGGRDRGAGRRGTARRTRARRGTARAARGEGGAGGGVASGCACAIAGASSDATSVR